MQKMLHDVHVLTGDSGESCPSHRFTDVDTGN